MDIKITANQLVDQGLDPKLANPLMETVHSQLQVSPTAEHAWQGLTTNPGFKSSPFNIQLFIFRALFPDSREHPETAPVWQPKNDDINTANISRFMKELNIANVKQFHDWTINHYQDFWSSMLKKLAIKFDKKPESICDLSQGYESPVWFPGGKLNIANSCFNAAPSETALIYLDKEKNIRKLSYHELDQLSNRVANGLVERQFHPGDAFGIIMPMNLYTIAIYLGVIKMGGVVISIPDSFSSQEIATRLKIGNAKAVFTQDYSIWAEKKLPLYEKIRNANAPGIIVRHYAIPSDIAIAKEITLRDIDKTWDDFLSSKTDFKAHPCDPMSACTILFSSGTTGEPKAIVWNHSTPIKGASDAYLHQNIKPYDVLAWPTNLGWMMGPWLIFAALVNQAAIALYTEAPKDRTFGKFVQDAGTTMLGVVPTLVTTWRQSKCMENLNWDAIKVFSSTGECSNPEDMFYLMALAGYKPVIEYCGGTEIGGAYLSSTVIEKNYPAFFSTPTMGMNLMVLDEQGHYTNVGEVAIIPPSIGLSTTLLNADHHKVYYENMPKSVSGITMRRHGDQVKRYPNGYYAVLGRADDTMKLGGIKISAAEIERALANIPQISEVAAIAISDHGPSQLIIFAATTEQPDKQNMMKIMQKNINTLLNPLFKIQDVVFVKELPKTASNKIMRRILRQNYARP